MRVASVTSKAAGPETSGPVASLLAQRQQFLRFVERRVSSPALAEDILQSAYMRALEHGAELRAQESSTAWFYRLLRNAVIDFYRRRTVEDRALEEWARELDMEVAPNDLTQDVVCGCIVGVLPSLKASYAEIVQKVDLEEEPLESFARRVGITVGNAGVRIHRARKALKQRLVEACGTCSLSGCLKCDCVACRV